VAFSFVGSTVKEIDRVCAKLTCLTLNRWRIRKGLSTLTISYMKQMV
jgi:hypothetical protein